MSSVAVLFEYATCVATVAFVACSERGQRPSRLGSIVRSNVRTIACWVL